MTARKIWLGRWLPVEIKHRRYIIINEKDIDELIIHWYANLLTLSAYVMENVK